MSTWRNELPTKKQLETIEAMEEFSEYPIPHFEGKTKGESSDYIDKWAGLAFEIADSEQKGVI